MTNTEAAKQFCALLSAQKAPLPLTDAKDGTVYDANRQIVFQVDPDNERPDIKVEAITRLIVSAINTCGGFKLTDPESDNRKDA